MDATEYASRDMEALNRTAERNGWDIENDNGIEPVAIYRRGSAIIEVKFLRSGACFSGDYDLGDGTLSTWTRTHHRSNERREHVQRWMEHAHRTM